MISPASQRERDPLFQRLIEICCLLAGTSKCQYLQLRYGQLFDTSRLERTHPTRRREAKKEKGDSWKPRLLEINPIHRTNNNQGLRMTYPREWTLATSPAVVGVSQALVGYFANQTLTHTNL